jgi:predicted alpha-1,2-mannosidase
MQRAVRRIAAIALVLACASACAAVPATVQVPDADPFVGSTRGGATVPGAGVPFGFVNFSPDTTRGDTSGYDDASPVVGFSVTHVSGTGGASKYGNFRVTPTVGPVNPRNLAFRRVAEHASPGFYEATIGNIHGNDAPSLVHVELTATRRVAVQRVTFPEGLSGNLLIDLTSTVQLGGGGPRSTGAHLEVHADGSLSGSASFSGGWNPGPWTLHFAAVFDRRPQASGAWTAAQGTSSVLPGAGRHDGGDGRKSPANRLGAYATFDTTADRTVEMKLAVSFISAAQARANLGEAGGDFDAVRARAESAWTQALHQIEVTGGTPDQRRTFYSALYRTHTMPHDLTGENVWWNSAEPHYEDFYTLWDTFRTVNPLMTLIQPQRERDMIRSLLDTYDHTGWLPDARVAGHNGSTQGGSNGDVVIADAVVKGLGGFDTAKAYEAIRKDGDVESDDPMAHGRVLKEYVRLGYVPLNETRSGSRTMEYAYNDFAIAEVARVLGHEDDARRFHERALGWRKLWNPALKCIHPRYADGSWLENYDCAYNYPDNTAAWWDHPFYEGSGWQYSTYVPGDTAHLIRLTGGAAGFTAWLDSFFDGGHYDQGNEPDILAPYLYIRAGRPDRTAERVRAILDRRYRPARDGLPGNDDAGTMSAWYVWSAIGLYPLAGQTTYFIGSPIFDSAAIRLEGGKTFTVVARGTSAANLYVQSATLNGKPWPRATLDHHDIARGGTLVLDMGPTPSAWATTASGAPVPPAIRRTSP